MFFNKEKKKSKFVKAKTPEARRKKAAIAAYYAKKSTNKRIRYIFYFLPIISLVV